MVQGWDSARFVDDDDDPFARRVADSLPGGNGAQVPVNRAAPRSAPMARHVVLLLLVVTGALLVGFGLWGTLSAVRLSNETYNNVVAWTWLVVLGWGMGLIGVVWALWATIRAARRRALPAVALLLGLLLPPFAAFVGLKSGAEVATGQLLGDVSEVAANSGWIAQLAMWLSGLLG